MPTGKNAYGVSFIQTSAGAMITGEIKRYATYKEMMEETAPTRLASVANASRDKDYDVPVEHQGGILYQRDYINSTWILLYTDADLSIPTMVEWNNILHVPAWVGGVSNNRVKLDRNMVGVPRTTYYTFGNKTDLSKPYRLLLPITGTEGLQLGDEIVLEQYENTSIVLYEKPEGVAAYEFEQTIVDTDGKTYFYIYTTPYYTFEVDEQGKPIANTEKPLTCNSYRFIYTETDSGIKVWRPCIVKDNIDPVITHLKQDLVDHAMAPDPHRTYIRRDEISQYIPAVATATITVPGIVRLSTYGDIDASVESAAVTPSVMKSYLVNNYSPLGHTHSVMEVFRQVGDTTRRLDNILDGKSDVGHTHGFYTLTEIPFETSLTVDNRNKTNTIVTPKMLAYEIDHHKHEIGDVNELQEALDNKSDVGHPHYINDVVGLPAALEALKPILNYWLQPNTTDEYGGILYIPLAGYDKCLLVQWGRLPEYVENKTETHYMPFHNVDGAILQMSPVLYVGLTTKPHDLSSYYDCMLQLGTVTSEGFNWFVQSFSSSNYAVGGYWMAIGLQTNHRVLSFEWGSHAALKNSTPQELSRSTFAEFAHISRKDIAYGYNANFMLVNPLATSSSSFSMFLNSMDSESNKEPCDWLVYGRASGSINHNTLTVPAVQADGTYSSGVALWVMNRPQCEFGNGWDKFKINTTTSFAIVYGYTDVSETAIDGTGISVVFPDDIKLSGIYHAAFILQNDKKQSVKNANNNTTSSSLSVDREVYLKSLVYDSTNPQYIVGFNGKSKEYGNYNHNKLKYRVYWTIYGYVNEANADGDCISGASIITKGPNTSYKHTYTKSGGQVDTPIGGNDVVVTIPILYNGSTPMTDIVWRFGSMKVHEESTMPETYNGNKIYYYICSTDLAEGQTSPLSDLPFPKEQMIITDFTCDGRTTTPGPHTVFHDGVHPWPFYDNPLITGEQGGLPVSVVFHGSPEVDTEITWMVMGYKAH